VNDRYWKENTAASGVGLATIYNPFDNAALSTIAAAIPVITLLVLIASGQQKL